MQKFTLLLIVLLFWNCKNDDSDKESIDAVLACTNGQAVNSSPKSCNANTTIVPRIDALISIDSRIFTTNNIPDHDIGLFGKEAGALGPNPIAEQQKTYEIPINPKISDNWTPLLSTAKGALGGPQYSFGMLFNGVELDPVAAEPFPHTDSKDTEVNWEWNLEALHARIGLDCNNAHVQPNGKYHYHGKPEGYIENLNADGRTMEFIGYAADGFPIYYKYAYEDPMDPNSKIVKMTTSYRLKSGQRTGDGVSAPCDWYNGVYTNDYEYVAGLGTLDQANGRMGVTPTYPDGTYYYVLTDAFPSIPRYFRGTPSPSFKIAKS